MPAGNDAAAAASELADKFGKGEARAEEVVAAARARRTSAVASAQLLPRDEEATEALDLKEVAKAAKVKTVLSAAVRGDQVVYVAEDKGRQFKDAVPASEVGKKAPARKKSTTAKSKKSE
jgi:hypothetical protein